MNLETKRTSKFNTMSVNLEDSHIVQQNSTEIHKHSVDQGYLILAKNDFGKVKTRVNVGYFNKKTNFMIGEKNSLMVLDKSDTKVKTIPTSEIIKNQSRYFMLYDLSFIKVNNTSITIQDKVKDQEVELKLTKRFGEDIGEFLMKWGSGNEGQTIPEEYDILNAILYISNNKISLNKHLLVNSNPEFLLGILSGYLKDSETCILKNNINIYNFVYILNLLGAQYSIRSLESGEKHIRFRLPLLLKQLSDLDKKYFRFHKYLIKEDEIIFERNIFQLIDPVDNSLQSLVNSGWIELIPMKDLKLLPVKDQIMYDLTMERASAQNFFLPMTPLLKNSDGDVLGIIAIHTKDAAQECENKFSTKVKQNFLNLSTGKVQNWGIKLDAALGLYNGTN